VRRSWSAADWKFRDTVGRSSIVIATRRVGAVFAADPLCPSAAAAIIFRNRARVAERSGEVATGQALLITTTIRRLRSMYSN